MTPPDDFNIGKVSDIIARAGKKIRALKEQADRIKTEQRMLRDAERHLAREVRTTTVATQRIEISTFSVVKAALAVLGIVALAWFFMSIAKVIILFLVAAFLAIMLDPLVDRLQSWHVPRALGILGIYIAFFGFLGFVIASFIPILTTEVPNLVNQVLAWVANYGIDTSIIQTQIAEMQRYLLDIQANLSKENIQAGLDVLSAVKDNAFAILGSVAGGIFSAGVVLVITFFMLIEEDGIKQFLIALFPRRHHAYIIEKATAVEEKFGAWFRGQLLLMLIMGVLAFIALQILGVKYALSLALLVAFAELLPYVGPIIAMTPALIIAMSQGGFWFAALVLGVYLLIQQLEGNVLIPLIMERAVGLSPVVIMFAMLVGASFPNVINPILGIILAVPVATAIAVFVQEYAEREK